MSDTIEWMVTVERKSDSLPRYVVLPAHALARWRLAGTTVVSGTLAGAPLGRRSLKPWGDNDRWFIDLPAAVCRCAAVDTGATAKLALRRASTALPEELETVLASDDLALAAWSQLTPSRQRMASEHVRAAKQAETRARRARRFISSLHGPS